MSNTLLLPAMLPFVEQVSTQVTQLSAPQRHRLQPLINYLQRAGKTSPVDLVFICTHNSRRSHFGQVWAAVWAQYFGWSKVHTYSGGTEATAVHPNALAALQRAGLGIARQADTLNPVYAVAFSDDAPPAHCFSKVYHDAANPQEGFCAIMTCSEADEACPAVIGAAQRIALPYDDPKVADGTPQEAARYDERCLEIATDLYYVFQQAMP